MDIDN